MLALQIEKYSAELEQLHANVKAAEATALQFNAQEAIFGLPATDYTAVKKLAEALEPFHALWTTADRCALAARRSCAPGATSPACLHCWLHSALASAKFGLVALVVSISRTFPTGHSAHTTICQVLIHSSHVALTAPRARAHMHAALYRPTRRPFWCREVSRPPVILVEAKPGASLHKRTHGSAGFTRPRPHRSCCPHGGTPQGVSPCG